jgi:hypothetical protein
MATIHLTVTISDGISEASGTLALDLPSLSPPVEPPEPPPPDPEPPPEPDPDVNPFAPAPPQRPAVAPGSSGRVLTVGPGGGNNNFNTVAAAMNAAQAGDTIRIHQNFGREAFILNKDVLVDGQGVNWDFGNVPRTQLAQQRAAISCNHEARWWHIRNFNISGAGILETTHTLTSGIRVNNGIGEIENCTFRRCQNGIGADHLPGWDLTIRNCDVRECGLNDGLTHGIYVNGGYRVRMIGGRSSDHRRAQAFKSRAFTTIIEGTHLEQMEGVNLDISNGGTVRVRDAVLVKPAGSLTSTVIAYAAEGQQSGLPDNCLVERTRLDLRRAQGNVMRVERGLLTFAADNTWQGNAPVRQEGGGRVVGLPG